MQVYIPVHRYIYQFWSVGPRVGQPISDWKYKLIGSTSAGMICQFWSVGPRVSQSMFDWKHKCRYTAVLECWI